MRLSIYVNVRSIAWIVAKGKEVIAKGIKRVNVTYDNYYEFISGNPISKRITRRLKRQSRRNLSQYKRRREQLRRYLAITPSQEDALILRVRALNEKLSPAQMANVFLSLQAKRGYKSMRGLSNTDESEYLKKIEQHEDELKKHRSVAEYLLSLDDRKNVILLRESHEREFELICEAQGIEDKRLHHLIYYQRPLRRKAISYCPLETNRKVCHYSHPDYQEFRIWRDVMNITLVSPEGEELPIDINIRKLWAQKLMGGTKLTKASCLKDLGIKRSKLYSWLSGVSIEGNAVVVALGENNIDMWHDIFSATDDTALLQLGKRKYNRDLTDIDFSKLGWGEFSHKAIMKLLPIMQQGNTLREAIAKIYGTVNLMADVTLRNLVLEQHYDSYISLIRTLKSRYTIAEIAVEISPLLKAGNKGRKEIAKRNRKKKKESESNYSDYEQHLLQLHKEFGGRSPYEPDKDISEDELLKNYNIDHIIPKSKLFEFGRENQTICPKSMNLKKGQMTGIEFARELGIEQEYIKFVDNAKISERKKAFLLMPTENIPSDWLSAIDYNTRCFAKEADYVIPNKIINKYLRDWGLDKFPDNDCRQSLAKCLVLANFNAESVEYFNNIKDANDTKTGRYNLTQEVFCDYDVIPYIPRVKYYRRNKNGVIPRHQLHDDSVMGQRKRTIRTASGKEKEEYYYTIRKPITSLTAAMVNKIADVHIRRMVQAHCKGKNHDDAMAELAEKQIYHNGSPIKRVAININAKEVVKINRGYVFSSMNHRYEPSTGKTVKLIDYIRNLNNGQRYCCNALKKHDVVRLDGKYYFVVGASASPILRDVFQLDAIGINTNKEMLKRCQLVRVSELGDIKYEQWR